MTTFKDIELQLTGDISIDAIEFCRLCSLKSIKLHQTQFLIKEVMQKLGNEFVLYLHEEEVNKKCFHHYVFITSANWNTSKEKSLIRFFGEIMSGEGHDGNRALLYLYSLIEPDKEIARYINWSHS